MLYETLGYYQVLVFATPHGPRKNTVWQIFDPAAGEPRCDKKIFKTRNKLNITSPHARAAENHWWLSHSGVTTLSIPAIYSNEV